MAIIRFTAINSLPHTYNGITYSNGNNGVFNLSGTASALSTLLLYYQTNDLPAWFEFDKTFKIDIERTGSGTVSLQMYMYDANGGMHQIFNRSTDGTFSVAASTGYVGMQLRIRIGSGTTVTGSFTPMIITPGEYHPRLSSSGIRYSPYWYSLNPFYNSGYGMPNCTCYAWGRFWEIADPDRLYGNNTRPKLSTGDGQDFYPHTQDGYPRGNTPMLGAIACYSGGNYSGRGHVCVLEKDNGDGTWTVSESAWDYWFFRASHKILANGDYNDALAGYTFQGFIYNPYAGDTDTPPAIEGGNFRLIYAKRALLKAKGDLIL